MRYALMIYSSPADRGQPTPTCGTWHASANEADAQMSAHALEEISTSGELIASAALADPALGWTITNHEGATQDADDPFTDTKEQLAGLVIVDCESPERAAEIAARIPDAGNSNVEIRPVMKTSGMEM